MLRFYSWEQPLPTYLIIPPKVFVPFTDCYAIVKSIWILPLFAWNIQGCTGNYLFQNGGVPRLARARVAGSRLPTSRSRQPEPDIALIHRRVTWVTCRASTETVAYLTTCLGLKHSSSPSGTSLLQYQFGRIERRGDRNIAPTRPKFDQRRYRCQAGPPHCAAWGLMQVRLFRRGRETPAEKEDRSNPSPPAARPFRQEADRPGKTPSGRSCSSSPDHHYPAPMAVMTMSDRASGQYSRNSTNPRIRRKQQHAIGPIFVWLASISRRIRDPVAKIVKTTPGRRARQASAACAGSV